MASTDARPVPRKNVAYRVTLPIWDSAGALDTAAGSLDSEVSIDGGAFADCTNEATEIGSSGIYTLDLTQDEMNGDTVAVIVKSSSGLTTPIILYPEEVGDVRADAVMISGDATAADNLETAADGGSFNLGGGGVVAASVTGAVGSVTGAVGSVTGNVGGTVASVVGAVGSVTGNVGGNVTGSVGSVVGNVGGIAGTTTTFDALQTALNSAHGAGSWATATGFSTLTQADVRTAVGLASANLDTQLAAIVADTNELQVDWVDGGRLDVLLDAVKAKTDQFVFTTANRVDATVVDKTGFALASTGMNLVVPADPSAIPVLGTANIVTWIGYFGAWTVNEVNSDSNSVDLRNSADNANLASHPTSDDGTTFSSGEPA